ncbi:MAG: (Fe-S)-binding protein [Candidatus Kryptoniota bacterium]
MRVFLFIPCYIDQLYPSVAKASYDVLKHLGCEVIIPQNQTCCGQPAFNTGYHEEARKMAIHHMRTFLGNSIPLFKEGYHVKREKVLDFNFSNDYVVGPSGSCIAMMRNFYPGLFSGDSYDHILFETAVKFSSRVYEFSEFIVNVIGLEKFSGRLKLSVSYHDSCHSLRELGIKKEPRMILNKIRDLKLIELRHPEICCGFGGTFSVKFPEISVEMGKDKLTDFYNTGAQALVSTDMSCLMHLSAIARHNGIQHRFAHISEIMVESLEI